MTEIIEFIMLIVPWVLAIGIAIYTYYLEFGKLPKTVDEWKAIAEGIKERKEQVEGVLEEVKSFFDPEQPMSKTSLETISKVIPSNSYMMGSDSKNRVLSYCDSEEEKQRVLGEIYDKEHPMECGEECCVYVLETSRATFKVEYGTPELITLKGEVIPLNQTKCFEICGLLKNIESFNVMWTIKENERLGINDYTISDDEGTVHVVNGEYTYSSN